MYLEYAWCIFHAILHQSTVIQGNSYGILFNGLLAELPTILNSFFNTTSDFIGVVGWGWWGVTKWWSRKNTCEVVTPPYGAIGTVDSPNQQITLPASRVATYSPVTNC